MLAPFTLDEIKEFERLFVDQVQRWEAVSTGRDRAPISRVFLHGDYPDTELRVVLVERSATDHRVGWRWRIWDSEEAESDRYGKTEDAEPNRYGGIQNSAEDWAEMAYMNLDEDLDTLRATDLGPTDTQGVKWIRTVY